MLYGKNHLGQQLTAPQKLADISFGCYDDNGIPQPYWQKENDIVDENGFDKRYKHTSGDYIETMVLLPGTVLCRYGADRGRMTTVYGTPYEMLGLPYVKETCPYHIYLVEKPVVVIHGIVAPAFGSPGGGVQHIHLRTIREEIECGNLREI